MTTTVTTTTVNDPILRDMAARGKNLLHSAQIFQDSFGRIMDRLRKGQQVEDYLCAEFYKAYHLLQTYNRAHDPETGKRFAQEVKTWQRAKVRVPYKDQPQPFLDCTTAITANINTVHSWFDE